MNEEGYKGDEIYWDTESSMKMSSSFLACIEGNKKGMMHGISCEF